MSSISEDIIRTTLLGVANTLGVRIDIPDETIADLAATLQAEIDRLEAVETESFEFLNELALAFRAAENHPRPQYAPVLEGVRAVLARLESNGRLVPKGGMPLTAEDGYLAGRVMAALCTRNGYVGDALGLVDALKFLEGALFPATEPAEERCRKWTVRVAGGIETGIQCVLPDGHECFHDYVPPIHNYVQPVPAEPAEEETKAEPWIVQLPEGMTMEQWIESLPDEAPGLLAAVREVRERLGISSPVVPAEPAEEETKAEKFCCHPKCRFTDWGGINRKHERGADCPIVPKPASSPVVPAPTETGPWQTWQEVPEGVKYYGVGDTYLDEPVVYVNRPSVVRHRVEDGKRSSTPDYEVESFAPFVAAEEG